MTDRLDWQADWIIAARLSWKRFEPIIVRHERFCLSGKFRKTRADVTARTVWNAMRRPDMTASDKGNIRHVALVSEQRTRIRDLSGFRRSHQVPDDCNDRTQSFVQKIAAADISEDLDLRFAEFRKHLKFKRLDLKVTEPENGSGAISTPWFEYRITITHCSEDVTEAIWRRQVSDFRNTKSMLSSQFASAFGRLFQTVEFYCPESIDMEAFIDRMEDRNDADMTIDYDRTSAWCTLTTSGIPGELAVASDRISLTTHQPQLPARLLEAFFQFREQLTGIDGFSVQT